MTWQRRYGLALLFLLVGLANLARAVAGWYLLPVMDDAPLSVPLPLLIAAYTLWGAAFVGMAGFWWQRSRLRRGGPALPLALAYQGFTWLLRLLGDRSAYARQLWGRDVVLTVIFLALVGWLTEFRMKNLE